MATIIKYCLVRTLKNLDFNKAGNVNSNGNCYSNDIWPNLNILLCDLCWRILCSHSFSFLFDNRKFIWRFFPLRLEPWSFQPHYTLIARQMVKLHVSDQNQKCISFPYGEESWRQTVNNWKAQNYYPVLLGIDFQTTWLEYIDGLLAQHIGLIHRCK